MSKTNMSELASLMLQWEQAQRRADEIKEAIQDAVLQIGKTQTVGNVRASYSAGRKSYDYETAWAEFGCRTDVDIEQFKSVSYDYRSACKAGDIDDVPFTQSAPSVTVKLI